MDDEYGHGHSVAAWAGVGLLILASTCIAVGVYFALGWLTWVGIAFVALGIAAWVGLQSAGHGQRSHHRKH